MTATEWIAPGQVPQLKPGETHLWRLELPRPASETAMLTQSLSSEERNRARCFYFPKDRHCYEMGRGMLRRLLASYLDMKPGLIRFTYGPYGKPALAEEQPQLHFNLSHVDGWLLFAFNREEEIGADLEWINRKIEVQRLARRFFSRMETPHLLDLSVEEQHAAFFRLWTRKEAVIKARGDGLSCPLDQFGVEIADQPKIKVVHTDWAPQEAQQWDIRSFNVAENLPAAVAMLGKFEKLFYFDFS